MFAQWCLTAWKVAIGRPNCWRTFAYSAACSVVWPATPTASAANTARATAVSSPRAPGSTVAGAPSRLTRAAGRLRVQGGGPLGPPAAGRRLDHQHVLARRDQQHVRQVTADHDAGRPGRGT